MKKKLLIALFITLMLCLFAFSVSAENEVTLVGGAKADFTTVFNVDSNNQVKGFNSGYSMNDITDVIFPDEIVGIECNFLFNKATNLNTLTFAATDTFFISGDNIFSGCSVKTITFNPDCIIELRKGNFSDCESLTQITFPKFKKLAGSAFKNCPNMVNTNDLVLAEGMTDIGGHVFNGCTSLKGTVYFPASLQTIQEYSFQNTGFEHFDLSKCVNLSAVGGGYGGPFTDNDSITSLDLSACVNLTNLKSNFASGCDSLTEVILPPNLETIPSKAFAHCYKLQSIVLPASLKTIVDEAFHSARSGQEIKTFTVYVQSNVQFGTEYSPFRDSGAKIEFVLFGDTVTVDSLKAVNTSYSAMTDATVVDYLDTASPWTYTVGGAITSHTIVKNYCDFLAVTKSHSPTDNACDNNDYCTDCEYLTCTPHEPTPTISYPNGYDVAGQKRVCSLAVCGASKPIDAKPLFEALGYSIKEKNGYGINSAYQINQDALKEYENANEKLTIGIFIANASFDGQDEFMSKNPEGKYVLNTTKGVQIEIPSSYSRIDAGAYRFTQSEATLNLVIALYVVDENGISYVQSDGEYAGEITKSGVALDVVTITRVAEIVDAVLPFVVPSQPAETKENG